MFTNALIILSFAFIRNCFADLPCDEFHGKFCPEDSGWGVGECLKKVDKSSLSPACIAHIALHDACKNDIEKRCNENAYTDYLTVCLTEWTQAADLSPECAAMVPKKEKKEEKELSAEAKRRAAKRRRIRNNAANMARSKRNLAADDDDDDDEEL
mmetsp:Transcript_39480/g.40231  ORF Transcript_39480/g.40231 Transcript_39480/m.40231 type:complete len:155 (+) Transcript_39480:55-519(+)